MLFHLTPVSFHRKTPGRTAGWLLRLSPGVRLGAIAICLGWLLTRTLCAQPEFRDPVCITQNDTPTANRQMSRNAHGQLQWGPGDRLSLVYWEGINVSNPTTPSRIWLRQWTPGEEWGDRRRVDQSFTSGDQEAGARHPTMIPRGDGALAFAWQDHRNCSASGSWINNTEIYSDLLTTGNALSDTDQRLTLSDAPTNPGDNAYVPQMAAAPDGTLYLAWYDFHWGWAEICLRASDTDGIFATDPPAMDAVRVTDASDRNAGEENYGFTTPSIAVDGDGIVHVVWGAIDETDRLKGLTLTRLYYGRYDPTQPAGQRWLEKAFLRDSAGGYYDPARLIADPATGDVWLVFIDSKTHGNNEIYIQRRGRGAADFGTAIRLTEDAVPQYNVEALMDGDGVIHLVYVDRTGGHGIRYMAYDTQSESVTADVNLTPDLDRNWFRPSIALDPEGHLFAVWEENTNPNQGELWFTTDHPGKNRVNRWELYE